MVDHLMDTPCTDNGEPSTTRENVSTAYPPVSFLSAPLYSPRDAQRDALSVEVA